MNHRSPWGGVSLALALLLAGAWGSIAAAAEPTLLEGHELSGFSARLDPSLPPDRAGLRLLADLLPLVRGRSLTPTSTHPIGGQVLQVRYQETVEGLPLFRGVHDVYLGADGRVLAVRLGSRADEPLSAERSLSAEEAVRLAAGALGEAPGALTRRPDERGYALRFDSSTHRDVLVRAMAYADEVATHPVWRVELGRAADPADRWCLLVHADTGEVLETIPLTRHAATRARVWPTGVTGPAEMVDLVDGEVVLHAGSPDGWLFDDATDGPNMTVWEDRAGDGGGTEGVLAYATGSDPLLFDFPFTGDPLVDLEAALVNVFWALNWAHDRFWELGFDEAAGNMQRENYGRGGEDGDWNRVYVQYRGGADASGIRNRNTAYASADGEYNNMTFGLWDLSGEVRDGALDTGLVYHEYAHLVVSRLVGGDNTCDDGQQPRALAEGWADYFAWAFTGDRVVGAWVSGDADVGLRTRKIGDNFYTLANFCNIRRDEVCNAENDGEIWSATLYDLRQAMVAAYGEEEGAERADRLVVEGMRYTPCQPTFLDARDGLLAADVALTGGADRCLVWSVLAQRGIGADATTTGPDDEDPRWGRQPGPACLAASSLRWGRARYGDDADARLLLAEEEDAPLRTIEVTTTGGDAETLSATGAELVRVLPVRLRPGSPTQGDGVVQVADGEEIVARCASCPGSPEARAPISTTLDAVYLEHRVSSESCHNDDADAAIDDFRNEVAGILDAGETATLTLTLGNREPFPLEDVFVRVGDDHPAVHVLPADWLPVGSVRATNRYGWPFDVDLEVLVESGVAFGETVTLTVEIRARGMETALPVELPLAADYLPARGVQAWGGVETFEADSPTAAMWTHFPAAGLPADQWDLRDCGDGGGRAMTYAGADCTDYDDTPSAATLVSPPLLLDDPDALVVHPVELSWRNEVGLGVDPDTGYCDSEMVHMYLADDPGQLHYDNPRGYRYTATQYWVQWPDFFDTRNTTGWETASSRNPVTTSTIRDMELQEMRLYWLFFTDVYNPQNSGGCDLGEPDAVGPGYRLDNVSFTYDALRLQPAAESCDATCVAAPHLVIEPPDGALCPGDIVHLSGELSSAAGCPGGVLEYRFQGPGLDTGWQELDTWEAAPDAGGRWTLQVRCRDDTSCSGLVRIDEIVLDDVAGGTLVEDSLRIHRDPSTGNTVLAWRGTRSPATYALFSAEASTTDTPGRIPLLEGLAALPPDDALRVADPEGLSYVEAKTGFQGGIVRYYRLHPTSPCAREVLLP